MAEVRPVGAPSAVAVDAPVAVVDQEARRVAVVAMTAEDVAAGIAAMTAVTIVGVAAMDPVRALGPSVVVPTERTTTTAVALVSCPRKGESRNPRSPPR